MAEYRSVEGPFTTIDTRANITTFADEASVGPVKVPAGANRLAEIWVAVAAEIAASEEHVYLMRLSGKGLSGGDQDFILGSAAAQSGTAAAGIMHAPVQRLGVDLAVVRNETINVSVGAAGTALSATGIAGITLVFE
jgi:hypothetical protein